MTPFTSWKRTFNAMHQLSCIATKALFVYVASSFFFPILYGAEKNYISYIGHIPPRSFFFYPIKHLTVFSTRNISRDT